MVIEIRKPDDFHVHFRAGSMLRLVAPETARVFQRALVMPNVPPIDTVFQMLKYQEEILSATSDYSSFQPLMTLKLGHELIDHPEMIKEAYTAGAVAVKLYPTGVTTGSSHGIDPELLIPIPTSMLSDVFNEMENVGMVLCIHAEDPRDFVLTREASFIRYIKGIREKHKMLKIVVEHLSSKEMVEYVRSSSADGFTAGTITPHHPKLTLDDVLASNGGGHTGLNPHHFCYPVVKTPADREALVEAMTSGERCFFAGTDSAPHTIFAKESKCGCAGIYNAPVALQTYAEMFEKYCSPIDWTVKLENFTSVYGAQFYDLPLNEERITLVVKSWRVPSTVHYDSHTIKIFRGDEILKWDVQ